MKYDIILVIISRKFSNYSAVHLGMFLSVYLLNQFERCTIEGKKHVRWIVSILCDFSQSCCIASIRSDDYILIRIVNVIMRSYFNICATCMTLRSKHCFVARLLTGIAGLSYFTIQGRSAFSRKHR